MGASPSSQLIAACYVLHRLRTPRHPPDALALTLDRSALVSHARRRTQDMERDHWIEILRSTGVQTGQSRLHYERERTARQGSERPDATQSNVFVPSTNDLRLIADLALAQAGGADRDRTDDLKLAKLALSQLSYGPWDKTSTNDRRSNGGPGTS